MLLQPVLYGGVLPAFFTVLVLAISGRPWRDMGARVGGWGGPVAVGGGFAVAFAAFPWTRFRPTESWHWSMWTALLAAAAGVVMLRCPRRVWVRWGIRVVVAAVTGWLMCPDYPDLQDTRLYWMAGLAAGIVLLDGSLERPLREQPGPLVPILLLVASACGSWVMLRAGFAKLTELSGALPATLGVCAVMAWWRRGCAPLGGAAQPYAVLLTALLFSAYINTYSDVPAASFLLVAAAPLGVRLPELLPLGGWSPFKTGLVRTTAVLVPLGVSVGLALWASSAVGHA